MTANDSSSVTWECPQCGRRVPRRLSECRCGYSQRQASSDADSKPSAAAEPTVIDARRTSHRLGWIAAGVMAVAFGALWFSTRRAPERPPPPVATRATPPPTATPSEHTPAPSSAAATPAPRVPEVSTPPPVSTPPVIQAAPELSLEEIVARALPAVVLIETPAGRGSGFFVSADTIVTNAHVVGAETVVTIRRAGGESSRASVQTVAPELDLAVLKMTTSLPAQPAIRLGTVSEVRPGQEVAAIGAPLGFQNSVTRGIVSSVRRLETVTLVQTDAAINPGNSGGPLLDRRGNAIGITTMGVRASQGLSFAVAADHAQALLSGQRSRSTSATPLSSLNAALQSDSGDARVKATSAYQQALAELARRADSLDDYWRRFKSTCYQGQVTGSFSREWFALWDPRALPGVVDPGCASAFSDIKRETNQIREQSAAAEEAARRADVYPGTRRDARRAYKLDFPGWDR